MNNYPTTNNNHESTEPLEVMNNLRVEDLELNADEKIPGLDKILYLFEHTTPQFHNTGEWQRIRQTIVSFSYLPDIEQLQQFVALLNTIKPLHDNIEEWNSIRATCEEIENLWATTNPKALFRMLLECFTTIFPQRDNQLEWSRIRDLSSEILRDNA